MSDRTIPFKFTTSELPYAAALCQDTQHQQPQAPLHNFKNWIGVIKLCKNLPNVAILGQLTKRCYRSQHAMAGEITASGISDNKLNLLRIYKTFLALVTMNSTV
jgi:hypothetical protein